jgi:hypothetical protein
MKSVILTVGLNHTTAPIQIRERIPAARSADDEAKCSLLLSLDSSLFPDSFALSSCKCAHTYLSPWLANNWRCPRFFHRIPERGASDPLSQFAALSNHFYHLETDICRTLSAPRVLKSLNQ